MGNFKFGCESYSWTMSGDKYVGDMPHICKTISEAGLSGIETSARMMGNYASEPATMVDLLTGHGLELAAVGSGSGYGSRPSLTDKERTNAERVFDWISQFPEPRLSLAHGSANRDNLLERQRNACACFNEFGMMAANRGVKCALHPSSYPTSLFLTDSDYRTMLDELDPEAVKYCPDSGHIVNGDMDIYEIFTTYASIIDHVHFKDITVDKKWVPMGEGVIDFPRIMRILDDAGYDGWIIFEEESPAARDDPDASTMKNGEYLKRTLRLPGD